MNLPLFLARKVAKGGVRSISRTIITIALVAVAVSMATMVVSGALISGFKIEVSEKIFGFWGHIHITDDSASFAILDSYQHPISNRQDFYPSLDSLGSITLDPPGSALGVATGEPQTTKGGVRHIQQFIILPGVVSVYQEGERLPTQEAIVLKGIDSDFNWDDFGQYIRAGEPLRITSDSTSKGIVVSQVTADRLELELGDRVNFNYIDAAGTQRPRSFFVSGVYKTGLEEFDRRFAIVDIKQPRRLLNWQPDQIGGFDVTLDDLDDLEVMNEYIHYSILPQDLYAETIRQKYSGLFNWLEIQNSNFALILILMTIVAIINMMTALLILILERTNMIGTLKALGQSNWSIRSIFLYYAGFIVIGGLILGNGIGLFLCWLQKTTGFITLDEENYYLAVAPINVEWGSILLLNIGTFLVTLVFLIVPSVLVTRIDPVKALRFK